MAVGRISATAFLAPRSDASFIELTYAVVAEFPEYLPYGGAHASLIPHLTIADGDAAAADLAEREMRADLERGGPVSVFCRTVKLLENSTGEWREMHEFALVGHQG